MHGEVGAASAEPLVAARLAEGFEAGGVLRAYLHEVHVAVGGDDVSDAHLVAYAQGCAFAEGLPLAGGCLDVGLSLDAEFAFGRLEAVEGFEALAVEASPGDGGCRLGDGGRGGVDEGVGHGGLGVADGGGLT